MQVRSSIRHCLVLTASVLLLTTGCATGGGDSKKPVEKSQVEARYFQTRTYPVEDGRLVMKAMINVLQDLGYVIKNADAQLGIINAERWLNVRYTKKEVQRAKKKETILPQTIVLECTANVSEFGKELRVRVPFLQRKLASNGAVLEVNAIENADFYQDFFSKVDKGLFLQKEGV